MPLTPRHLSTSLSDSLTNSRIVNVVGPRQDGKSTLVRDLLKSAAYVTLDDDAARRSLEEDPYSQLKALSHQAKDSGLPVVIDEVQRLPELTFALKRIVDQDNRRGHFVLTGSANIFTSGKAYDSLAGRVTTLTLRPFSTAEIYRAAPCRILDAVASDPKNPLPLLPKPRSYDRPEIIDLVVRGGFPEMRQLPDRDRMGRCSNYVDSIIERDVSAVHPVRKPDAVRRLIYQAAARTAQELNAGKLASDLAVRHETVSDYLDALTRLGIVLRLGAWSSAKAKREVKSPKLHLMDTGLAAALRGEDSNSFGIDADPAVFGSLFETFVFTELEKSLPFLSKHWSLWHWRADSREIDILAEAPGRLIALFEMKATSKIASSDFRHIDWFLTEGPGKSYRGVGFVVYLGEHLLSFGPGRVALPASMLWSFPAQ
ncbi:MAG: ATP-binding protein [Aquamicrobium sp.]|nr:ATP-binding protein [Aquamicrobium sp.]